MFPGQGQTIKLSIPMGVSNDKLESTITSFKILAICLNIDLVCNRSVKIGKQSKAAIRNYRMAFLVIAGYVCRRLSLSALKAVV